MNRPHSRAADRPCRSGAAKHHRRPLECLAECPECLAECHVRRRFSPFGEACSSAFRTTARSTASVSASIAAVSISVITAWKKVESGCRNGSETRKRRRRSVQRDRSAFPQLKGSGSGSVNAERSIEMKLLNRDTEVRGYVFLGAGTASLIALAVVFWMGAPLAARNGGSSRHTRCAVRQHARNRAHRRQSG